MKKPTLPKNAITDSEIQRQKRLDYLFHLIEDGSTVDSSCMAAGIARKTFYHWINKDPELMARYEEAQLVLNEKVAEVAKLCALKALSDHRYQSSMFFFLKCRAGWNDGSGFVTGAQDMPSVAFISATKPKPEPKPVSEVTS